MSKPKIDISKYRRVSSRKEQLARIIWNIVWALLARPIPRSLLNGWKLFLLQSFGAKVHKTSVVYSEAKIYAPWHLEMREYACIGSGVNCYNADKISIGAHATVSQNVSLCTASHNIVTSNHKWFCAPIVIKDQAWVAAEAFIMPGITIGQGAVVGARAVVTKNVEPWTVVGGNPARFIKKREIIC